MMSAGIVAVFNGLLKPLKLILPVFATSYCISQNDTLNLATLEITDSVAVLQEKFTAFTFDSIQYAGYQNIDAGEFISQNTSIYIKDYGPGTTSSLSYRGSTAYHTKIYWKGISVDNAMLGQSDLSLYNLGDQLQMDFLKAGNSLSLGSGGFGGIINLEENSTTWNGYNLETSYSAGSYGYRKIPVDLFIGNGKWKLESGFNYTTSDNNYEYVNYLDKGKLENRENAAYRRIQFLPNVSYRLNKRNQLTLSYWYTNSEREVPSAIGTNHGNAVQNDTWNRLMAGWKYSNSRLEIQIKSMVLEDELMYVNDALYINSENRVNSFKNQLMADYRIGKFFISGSQLKADITQVISNNYNELKRQDLYGFYESLSYNRKRFTSKAAIRAELQSGFKTYFMPSLSIGGSPISDFRYTWFFANFSYNVRMPSFNEQFWLNSGNPELLPENSEIFELGINQEIKSGDKSFSEIKATAFYGMIENLIVWLPENGIWIPKNVNSVVNSGVEAEIKMNFQYRRWRFSMNGGYAYTSSRVMNNGEYPEMNGKQQIYVPMNKVHWLLFAEWRNFFLSCNQVLTGEVFTTTDNNSFLTYSYPVFFELGKKTVLKNSMITAKLTIQNLFNEDYQYVASMPMPKRLINFTLIYQLNKSKP